MSVIKIMSARPSLSGFASGVGSTMTTLPLHSSMSVAWLIGVILRSPAAVGNESTEAAALAGATTDGAVPAELGAGRSVVLQARTERAKRGTQLSNRMPLATPAAPPREWVLREPDQRPMLVVTCPCAEGTSHANNDWLAARGTPRLALAAGRRLRQLRRCGCRQRGREHGQRWWRRCSQSTRHGRRCG